MQKQERPIDTGIKVGCFFTPKWNIDFLWGGIHIGKKTHTKKSTFSWRFFCEKNDEGENCQQRKALTSSPMRIAQFHEKSFFKGTKNYVKSHGFEQASVGVSNRNSKKTLETCCFKNSKKLLLSPKVANDKMSPQKPNPI